MNRVIKYSLFLLFLISCEKDDFDLQKAGKLKTKYIYSSSTDSEPYSFTTYYYDDNWNLIKELISDYPKPVWASYTYEYSEDGQLSNKQHRAIEGLNSPDQTEADFILLWEKNIIIEIINKLRWNIEGEPYQIVLYLFMRMIK